MLVSTKQLYRQKWFKNFRVETLLLDDNVKSKENVKISKSVSLFLLAYSFSPNILFRLFFIVVTKQLLPYDFGSRIWLKMSFTPAGLKNWRHASTNAATATENSFSSDRRMYLDAIIWP